MHTLILLVGKSGSGKNYLVKSLGCTMVVSYTTRPIREGETDGVDHHFVTDEFFHHHRDTRTILAYTYYNKHHYWVTADDVIDKDVYIIDPVGIRYFQSALHQHDISITTKIVYVYAPWYRRFLNMRKRGDSIKNACRRLWYDRYAFETIQYDTIVRSG